MPRLAPALCAAAVLAGCGGGGDENRLSGPSPREAPAERRAAPPGDEAPQRGEAAREGQVTAGEEAVIRGWADALRGGDVEAAVRFWAVPATASNGGPPYRLETVRAVRFFNEALPCGAALVSTERVGGYVLATFRLTERPGEGECGSGTGNHARTTFRIRDGRIAEWLRAADPPPPPSEGPGGTES
jgi:hypothetical protein